MAFTKLSDYWYTALSTDVKITVGVIIGARLIEYDTDIQWVFDGTTWREIEGVNIPYEHKRVHLGKMWDISALFEAVADDASADVVIEHTIELHAVYGIAAAGAGHIFIYEAPTISSGTSAVVANACRPIGDDGAPTGTQGPTVAEVGTKRFEGYHPGGSGGNAPGGANMRDVEFILCADTKYLFRLTNKKGQAADISWAIFAYEHD